MKKLDHTLAHEPTEREDVVILNKATVAIIAKINEIIDHVDDLEDCYDRLSERIASVQKKTISQDKIA